MNRTALIGLLAFTVACDIPLVMVEVEVPSICVTRTVDIESMNLTTLVSGTNELPSAMAGNLSGSLGTTIDLKDTLVDLPAEAKGLLDLDVQIQSLDITALPPHADALDGANTVIITLVPPDGSGLTSTTILSYDRATAGTPPGGTIAAGGNMINLADYLYSGQLRFTYSLNATIVVVEAWQAEVKTCIKTRGYAAASVNDLEKL